VCQHWQPLWSTVEAPLLWRDLHPGGLSSANTALPVLVPKSSNLREVSQLVSLLSHGWPGSLVKSQLPKQIAADDPLPVSSNGIGLNNPSDLRTCGLKLKHLNVQSIFFLKTRLTFGYRTHILTFWFSRNMVKWFCL
jgi:hypothetical protein